MKDPGQIKKITKAILLNVQTPSLSDLEKQLRMMRRFSSSNLAALDIAPFPEADPGTLRGSPGRRILRAGGFTEE